MVRAGLVGMFVALVCSTATASGGSSFAEPLRAASESGSTAEFIPAHLYSNIAGALRREAARCRAIRRKTCVFFCKGPDYSKGCVALTAVDGAHTIAVNDPTGRTVLLEYNNSTFSRVCTINAAGFRPSLDCSVVDSARLAEYGVRRGVNGSLLMVEAVDGKYICGEPSGFRQCSRVSDKAGRPIQQRGILSSGK